MSTTVTTIRLCVNSERLEPLYAPAECQKMARPFRAASESFFSLGWMPVVPAKLVTYPLTSLRGIYSPHGNPYRKTSFAPIALFVTTPMVR